MTLAAGPQSILLRNVEVANPPADTLSRPTVVYVMGYGRSGSTILDIVLQQHPEVASTGELYNLCDWRLRNEMCGCGLPISECAFWMQVFARIAGDADPASIRAMRRLESAVESLTAYLALACGLHSQRRLAAYARQMERLFDAVAAVIGKRFVVDSSKTARACTGRPLALARHTNLNVKVIYLVRDGRGVAWSVMRRSGSDERQRRVDRPLFNFSRALFGWTSTNALALATRSQLPREKVLTVRYEDLCDRTDETLIAIGDFLGLDMTPVIRQIAAGGELTAGHNLGGNRVRFTKSGLTFRPDYEWKEKLPWTYRRFFEAASWPVSAALGYGRRGS